MGFRFRRSVKLFPGLRLNFGKRGISASIGVRGAHVTYGPTGTRTTVGLPGSGLSYTHLQKSHHAVPSPTDAAPPADVGARQGSAWRGFLWIGLIAVVFVVAVGRMTSHAPPLQVSIPQQTLTQTATQVAAQAAENERSAEAKSAAIGVAQIRNSIANSNTLNLSRVTMMPDRAICYRFHVKNSRGVTYVRTAVMDGRVLKASGSIGFTELWNRSCAHSGGRDITSEVETAVHFSGSK